ncbi:MAG: hypothetical protein RL161_160 [Bacteroidota bacterium]|jgi:Uma2 family endonuclease
MEITSLSQLNPDKTYSHLEYLSWKFQDRVELILGKIFPMSPAANLRHQHCSMMISASFVNYFKGTSCRALHAPLDVYFIGKDGLSDTVLQPDLIVVCDPSKLELKGCVGAPDLVVEILSPSTATRDVKDKYFIYETYGVKEYWIVQPEDKTVTIHTHTPEGKFQPLKMRSMGEKLESPLFPGLTVDLDETFKTQVWEEKEEYGNDLVRI